MFCRCHLAVEGLQGRGLATHVPQVAYTEANLILLFLAHVVSSSSILSSILDVSAKIPKVNVVKLYLGENVLHSFFYDMIKCTLKTICFLATSVIYACPFWFSLISMQNSLVVCFHLKSQPLSVKISINKLSEVENDLVSHQCSMFTFQSLHAAFIHRFTRREEQLSTWSNSCKLQPRQFYSYESIPRWYAKDSTEEA